MVTSASAPRTLTKSEHAVRELLDSWNLERVLGSGSQAYVWRARNKSDGRLAAVKLLRNCSDARREVEAYARLREFVQHPNVLDVDFGCGAAWARSPFWLPLQ